MKNKLTDYFKDFFLNKIPSFVKEQVLDIKEPSNRDNTCHDVVISAIYDPQSKLIYSPKTGDRAIIWPTYGAFILIEHRLVIICKGTTSKRCFIDSLKLYNNICACFDSKLEEDLIMIRDAIKQADENFFENILF